MSYVDYTLVTNSPGSMAYNLRQKRSIKGHAAFVDIRKKEFC